MAPAFPPGLGNPYKPPENSPVTPIRPYAVSLGLDDDQRAGNNGMNIALLLGQAHEANGGCERQEISPAVTANLIYGNSSILTLCQND